MGLSEPIKLNPVLFKHFVLLREPLMMQIRIQLADLFLYRWSQLCARRQPDRFDYFDSIFMLAPDGNVYPIPQNKVKEMQSKEGGVILR